MNNQSANSKLNNKNENSLNKEKFVNKKRKIGHITYNKTNNSNLKKEIKNNPENKSIQITKLSSTKKNENENENENVNEIKYGFYKPNIKNINDKKIFIGNLPYKTNERELKKYYEKCGKIKKVVINKTNDGVSMGHWYIIF